MSYLGPDNMELPEPPEEPREPFTISPNNMPLARALIKSIEQGYELTFVHDEHDYNGLGTEPYTVTGPAEVDDWWECTYPSGFEGAVRLTQQLTRGYRIKVVPR